MKTAIEMVERMEALTRRIAGYKDTGLMFMPREIQHEARAIVFELPDPVDQYAPIARAICYDVLMEKGASAEAIAAGEIQSGDRDDAIVMHVALAAIRRGIELQHGEG